MIILFVFFFFFLTFKILLPSIYSLDQPLFNIIWEAPEKMDLAQLQTGFSICFLFCFGHVARGILVPLTDRNLCSCSGSMESPKHWTTGEFPESVFLTRSPGIKGEICKSISQDTKVNCVWNHICKQVSCLVRVS